jgi:hypothetical protein
MSRYWTFFALLVGGATAYGQFPPPPPVWPAPPYPVYPSPRPIYAPPPVYPAPVYPPPQPWSRAARRALILRSIGIPLLALGVPMVMAGGVVSIVGAACDTCSPNVATAGWSLLGVGSGFTIAGAVLVGPFTRDQRSRIDVR